MDAVEGERSRGGSRATNRSVNALDEEREVKDEERGPSRAPDRSSSDDEKNGKGNAEKEDKGDAEKYHEGETMKEDGEAEYEKEEEEEEEEEGAHDMVENELESSKEENEEAEKDLTFTVTPATPNTSQQEPVPWDPQLDLMGLRFYTGYWGPDPPREEMQSWDTSMAALRREVAEIKEVDSIGVSRHDVEESEWKEEEESSEADVTFTITPATPSSRTSWGS